MNLRIFLLTEMYHIIKQIDVQAISSSCLIIVNPKSYHNQWIKPSPVPDVTYNVFGETLNLTQSNNKVKVLAH